MTFLLSTEQTYSLEKDILKKNKLSIEDLMAEAGAAVWHQLLYEYGQIPQSICIFLGSGNNAGDALVLALHAIDAGVKVDIVEVLPPKSKLLKTLLNKHTTLQSCYVVSADVHSYDVVVDGIMGIGFTNKEDTSVTGWIDTFNQMQAFKVAIDIPSGVDCNSGMAKSIVRLI